MYKFQSKNISNLITNKILNFLKFNTDNILEFNLYGIKTIVPKKNIWYLKGLNIKVNCIEFKKNDKRLLWGYCSPTDYINIFINKNDVNKFRENFKNYKISKLHGYYDNIEFLRREILLCVEHELTHMLQMIQISSSIPFTDIKYPENDYREIEAVTNEIIKLKNDYRIDIKEAIYHCLNSRKINRKKVLKKLYKRGELIK